ncbi:MAG: peptide chain release factor N(5)-glutamine methyltransferase [Dehalococcoidia bacterium]|nr:peptide chain release factor N(5)-glutamine methyltransferase [Dehalococcoidia bacterium]
MERSADRTGEPGGASLKDLLERTRARLKAVGIEEYQLEGELLLQHVLNIDSARMFAALNDRVDPEAETQLHRLTVHRESREPLAYITGRRAFYGREFEVTPDVLIPRTETELLVELVLGWVTEYPEFRSGVRIADIGTGSGTLAVTLAAELRHASVDAVDLSPPALVVARANASRFGVVDRIEYFEGDLAAPLAGRNYQIVVANLPYVRSDTFESAQQEVRREPVLALLGGEGGLDVVRRLAPMLEPIMDASGSIVLFEIDPLTYVGAVEALSEALPSASIRVELDLAGLERCVVAELG